MKSRSTLAITALAAAILLVACDKPAAKPASPDVTAEAADKDAAGSKTIPGLKDEKAQASYVVGMTMGKQLEDIKDDIDLDIMIRGLKEELGDGKKLVDEDQAREIMASFMEKLQAKAMADQMAKARKNAEEGQKFLAENAKKEGVTTTASGLQYQVLTEGKGGKPGEKSVVKVKYKGELLDGTEFDSTEKHGGEPAQMPLDRVIAGWAEGIRLMPVGSTYKFWIPANLGYGEMPPPGAPIPPNATLVFEVELLEIGK